MSDVAYGIIREIPGLSGASCKLLKSKNGFYDVVLTVNFGPFKIGEIHTIPSDCFDVLVEEKEYLEHSEVTIGVRTKMVYCFSSYNSVSDIKSSILSSPYDSLMDELALWFDRIYDLVIINKEKGFGDNKSRLLARLQVIEEFLMGTRLS